MSKPFDCQTQVTIRFATDGRAHVDVSNAKESWSMAVPLGLDAFTRARNLMSKSNASETLKKGTSSD